MTADMIYSFMEQAVQWTFIVMCICFWGVGMISIWKWFIGVVRRMLRYLFPYKFRKKEEKDNADL